MHHRGTALRTLALVALASLGIGACGSSSGSSGDPNTLLRQTFTGTHKVTSGVLKLTLTVDPSGSSVLNGPITLSFGGPFQTRGSGQLPESNFTVSVNAVGRSVSLGILSTGTAGYVTLQGTSYQMPPATFQKLESSFAQLASSAGTSQSSGTLANLGIHPLQWLTHPSVVGYRDGGRRADHAHPRWRQRLGAADRPEHVPAEGVLGRPVRRAQPEVRDSARPPARRSRPRFDNPSFDVWTGTDDKTVRRLTVAVTVPVTGDLSSQLGGMRSADIGLTLQYASLNQPQKITAPTTVRPFSEFQKKVAAFAQGLQGAAAGVLGGASASSSGGTSPGAGTSTNVQKYSQCIQQAAGDVAKMQKCASLLGSGG